MSYIGAHVSIAGGTEKAAERAKKQGCEVMQIFVQSPQTFKTSQTTDEEIKLFKASLKKYTIKEVYVHAPYLINLASENNRTRYGSINIIKKNLERASFLGCTYLMTHMGSFLESSHKAGIDRVVKSIQTILEGYTGTCGLLLELSAGSGHIIGSKFEEIQYILKKCGVKNLGVCLDTAHIFSSGYSLIGKKAITDTLKKFDATIGLNNLKLAHLNDSTVPFASRKDRHADIGDGEIGAENIILLINHSLLKKCNFILETPGEADRRKKDIDLLKKYRQK